jgi:hypothetical protein
MTRIENATTRLPELPDLIEQGEKVAILRNVAELGARVPSRRAAFYGAWQGQVDMSRFDEADEEIAREFGMLD